MGGEKEGRKRKKTDINQPTAGGFEIRALAG